MTIKIYRLNGDAVGALARQVEGGMTKDKLSSMSPGARVEWLRALCFLEGQDWSLGEKVFCLHCDDSFMAEEITCDGDGIPVCPRCQDGCPVDFSKVPWWRP